MFLCLVAAVSGTSVVAGKVDDEYVVRSVGRNINLSSVDSKGPNYQDCEVVVDIDERPQFCCIACVVHVNKEDFDVGDGDECRARFKYRKFQAVCACQRFQSKWRERKIP